MSSKNSKRIVSGKKKDGTTYPKVIMSKQAMAYVKKTDPIYRSLPKEIRKIINKVQKPMSVGFKFYRKTKRAFDYNNMSQIVQDQMVKHDWIEDDDYNNLIPVFLPVAFDKENPGVEIVLFLV